MKATRRHPLKPRWHCLALVSAFAGSLGTPARGDTVANDGITAQALFDQAKRLIKEGRFSEACPKLEESHRLDPGSGTLINLADCFERIGRRASAWNYFLEAGALAEASGNADRATAARERAAAIEPTLGRILISVPPAVAAQNTTIRRDGLMVGSAQWEVAVPVDSGSHEITAAAPNKQSWSTTVDTRDQGQTTRIEIPVLTDVPVLTKPIEPTKPESAAQPSHLPTVPFSAPERTRGLSAQRTGAIVSAGFGVIGVALGTAFGLQSKSARDEAAAYCRASECWNEKGVQLKSDAITAGNLSTVMFVIGAAGIAGGAVLWLTDPAPRLGVGANRVSVEMTF